MRLIPRDKAWILAVWAAVCIVAIFSMAVPRGYILTCFGDLTQCLLLMSVCIACFTNVNVSERRARFFWVLMALGFGLWLSAQMLWTYFEVLLHREVPNPFVGDVILFLHLVPMMGALAMQPHVERAEHSARLGVLDFVLLLVWWLYLYLFVVIPWQYVHFNETLYGRSFDLVYFAEHVVFLVVAGTLWRRTTGDWRAIYGHLLGASLLYALSSITASVAIDLGQYYTGSFYDVPLVAAVAWFSGMALVARRLTFGIESPKEADEKRGGWIARLAMVTILSLPVLAGWALFHSQAPLEVRSFRLLLTLATMMIMGTLLALKQHRLDKELARANQELREASLTDLLTGARNRRFLTTTIDTDVRQVIRFFSPNVDTQGKPNCDLIFYLIDADHFKEVNDLYGHEVGDQMLVETARRISSAIRHSDVLIRWGGEEFLVVSRYTNRNEGDALAARVLNAVGGGPFEVTDGQSMRRTCSIGWAVFPWFVSEPEAVHYQEVLRLADSALYQAKKAGRNQAIGMLPTSEGSIPVRARNRGDDNKQTEHLPARTLVTQGPPLPSKSTSGGTTASTALAATPQDA